jgi:hypothetical protein
VDLLWHPSLDHGTGTYNSMVAPVGTPGLGVGFGEQSSQTFVMLSHWLRTAETKHGLV